jgi:hypothetical protein
MATLSTTEKERFFLDLKRDDCKIIERRGSAPADLKKAFGKLNRILAKMPLAENTALDLKKTRESRARK